MHDRTLILEVLTKLEWQTNRDDFGAFSFCPMCLNLQQHGHDQNCRMRKAIQAVTPTPSPAFATHEDRN